MKKSCCRIGWTKYAALSAFVVGATVSAAHAQLYSTGFDGTDIVNGTSTATTYSTAFTTQGTAPLAGQNSWGSNDSAAGTAVAGNPPASGYQTNGGTTSVGAFGGFTGNSGIIGGQYRDPGNTTDSTSPDVVPSTASGGTVNLFHSVTSGALQYVFTVDFDVSASTSVAPGHDSFAFTLRNTTSTTVVGTPLVSISFVVPTTGTLQATTDAVDYTVGTGTAVATGQGITINSANGPGRYRLTLNVTASASPTFTASLLPVDANDNAAGMSVALTTAGPVALTSGNVNQFSADWSLADKTTIANGGYTGAGTNALEFDNLSVTVPEPSTYALLALGLLGLTGGRRWHRRQA